MLSNFMKNMDTTQNKNNMASKIKSTPQTSMSKTLEKHREQLEIQSKRNDIRQSNSYISERNTIIR